MKNMKGIITWNVFNRSCFNGTLSIYYPGCTNEYRDDGIIWGFGAMVKYSFATLDSELGPTHINANPAKLSLLVTG